MPNRKKHGGSSKSLRFEVLEPRQMLSASLGYWATSELLDLPAVNVLNRPDVASGPGSQINSFPPIHQPYFVEPDPGDVDQLSQSKHLIISGDGFFLVKEESGKTLLTREVTVKLDPQGYFVTSKGHQLLGYQADESGNLTTSELTSLQIPLGRVVAEATTSVVVRGFLNPDLALQTSFSTQVEVYDPLGEEIELEVEFSQISRYSDSTDISWQIFEGPEREQLVGSGTLRSDQSGNIIEGVTANIVLNNENMSQEVGINFSELKVLGVVDARGIPQYSIEFFLTDGFPPSEIESYLILEDGTIVEAFDNGRSRLVGQISLARISNPHGLIPRGGRLYETTSQSGLPRLGLPHAEGMGSLFELPEGFVLRSDGWIHHIDDNSVPFDNSKRSGSLSGHHPRYPWQIRTLRMEPPGDAFFVLQDHRGRLSYSQNGRFRFNQHEQLVTPDGKLVSGYQRVGDQFDTSQLSPITISTSEPVAKATESVRFEILLSINSSDESLPSITRSPSYQPEPMADAQFVIFNEDGNQHRLSLSLEALSLNAESTTYHWKANPDHSPSQTVGEGTLVIASDGTILEGEAAELVIPNDKGEDSIVNLSFDTSYYTIDRRYRFPLESDPPMPEIPDNTLLGVNFLSQDGLPPGYFKEVRITETGEVVVRYDTGLEQSIAQLALAKFPYPEQLQRTGVQFRETARSGTPTFAAPGENGTDLLVDYLTSRQLRRRDALERRDQTDAEGPSNAEHVPNDLSASISEAWTLFGQVSDRRASRR